MLAQTEEQIYLWKGMLHERKWKDNYEMSEILHENLKQAIDLMNEELFNFL